MTLGIPTEAIPIASAIASMTVLLLGIASLVWAERRDRRRLDRR